MKKIIILLLILNIFLISGCVKYEIKKCEKIVQLEDRDQCYYDLSLKTEDKNICNLIILQAIKGDCYWHFSEKERIDNLYYPDYYYDNKIIDLSQPSVTIKIGESKQDFLGFRNIEFNQSIFELVDTFNISSNNNMSDNCRSVNLDFESEEGKVNFDNIVIIPFKISVMNNTKEDVCTYTIQVNYGFDERNLNNMAVKELRVEVVK